jgi:hypothetical protein
MEVVSVDIDQILEMTVDIANEECNPPMYYVDIDKLLDNPEDFIV